jgi:hypothetical protein
LWVLRACGIIAGSVKGYYKPLPSGMRFLTSSMCQ